MHLHVEDRAAPTRWDFVTGVSVYRYDPPTLESVEGSRFDVAFGAMATSSSALR